MSLVKCYDKVSELSLNAGHLVTGIRGQQCVEKSIVVLDSSVIMLPRLHPPALTSTVNFGQIIRRTRTAWRGPYPAVDSQGLYMYFDLVSVSTCHCRFGAPDCKFNVYFSS